MAQPRGKFAHGSDTDESVCDWVCVSNKHKATPQGIASALNGPPAPPFIPEILPPTYEMNKQLGNYLDGDFGSISSDMTTSSGNESVLLEPKLTASTSATTLAAKQPQQQRGSSKYKNGGRGRSRSNIKRFLGWLTEPADLQVSPMTLLSIAVAIAGLSFGLGVLAAYATTALVNVRSQRQAEQMAASALATTAKLDVAKAISYVQQVSKVLVERAQYFKIW